MVLILDIAFLHVRKNLNYGIQIPKNHNMLLLKQIAGIYNIPFLQTGKIKKPTPLHSLSLSLSIFPLVCEQFIPIRNNDRISDMR